MNPSFVARPALAALAFTVSAAAQAVSLVGITSSNEVARFDSGNVGAATRVAISGLDVGDRFVGIDLRPSDNRIYGVTLTNRVYTLDDITGAATFVSSLSAPVIGGTLGWGVDFNPVADYGGAASLRVVSTSGSNFAVNVNNGTVGNAASNIGTGYSGVGYTNSVPLGSAPASTALYYINSETDTLAMAPGAFNAPTISTVGALGVDVLRANGFEVLANGMAYAAFNVDDGTLGSSIYSIDLGTGAATMIGGFNGTLSGLTVSPVPEASTYAMMALGLGFVGVAARRRRMN